MKCQHKCYVTWKEFSDFFSIVAHWNMVYLCISTKEWNISIQQFFLRHSAEFWDYKEKYVLACPQKHMQFREELPQTHMQLLQIVSGVLWELREDSRTLAPREWQPSCTWNVCLRAGGLRQLLVANGAFAFVFLVWLTNISRWFSQELLQIRSFPSLLCVLECSES